jgi:hypothetical protein
LSSVAIPKRGIIEPQKAQKDTKDRIVLLLCPFVPFGVQIILLAGKSGAFLILLPLQYS